MLCNVLRNLSCIVLRIVRENHRRGQKQDNQKVGEGEGNNNTRAQTMGADRERERRGDGFCFAHCWHSACKDGGEGRRGADRAP